MSPRASSSASSGGARAAVAALLLGAGALSSCAGGSAPGPPAAAPAGAAYDAVCRRNNLGVALMDHGGYEEAAGEFRAALALWEGCVTARANLGIALYYAKQPEAARAELEAALAVQPDHARARYVLGLYHAYVTARHEEAVAHFEAVAGADPDDAWTRFYLGLSLLKLGRFGPAAAALRSAVESDPGLLAARYHLSLALRRDGRAAEAGAELASFTRLRGELPGGSAAPGVGYLEQGRHAEAEAMTRPGKPGDVAFLAAEPDAEAVARIRLAASRLAEAEADVDNDGLDDRLRVEHGRLALERRGAGGAFTDVTRRSGLALPPGSAATAAAFADVDHDGDVDVYVCREAAGGLLFRNTGTGRFVEVAARAGVAGGDAGCRGVVFADFDGDRAIDAAVARSGAPPLVLYNNRDGTFAERSEAAGLGEVRDASGVAAGDVNHDGYPDLLFAPDGPGPLRLFLGRRGRRFAPAARSSSAIAELAFARPACGLIDADLDGDLDAACVDSDAGRPALFANQHLEAAGRRSLPVRAHGRIRPQVLSNYSAVGAKLEVRAAGLWLRREVQASTGDLSAGAGEVLFGLGDVERLDYVRAVFPSGVRLTVRDVDADRLLVMEEPAGKYTSCPMLYAWDGARFAFVGDLLGAAVLGEWEPPGRWMRPDPDEWVLIESGRLALDGGAARLRFVNQLEEVDLLDHVRLVAVDHPLEMEVLPDERLLLSPAHHEARPPGAGPRLHAVVGARALRAARDARGRDVTAALDRRDGRYHDDLPLLPWRGLAEPHRLVLEPAPGALAGRPVLLLHGWTEWGSSSSLRGAWQAGVAPRPLLLEAQLPGGAWVTVAEDAGVPAGLPRTIAVPLEGAVPPDARRLRLTTNMMVFWDDARLGQAAAADLRLHELALGSAELRWLGYPRAEGAAGRAERPSPVRYLYDERDPSAEWGTMAGSYTRYGDVRDLLEAGDDRLVVMNHGEEVALEFSGEGLPPLPPGWRRDFLLYARGWGKDRDVNSARPHAVEPLPYGAMAGYPYAASEDPLLRVDLLESHLLWNRRSP